MLVKTKAIIIKITRYGDNTIIADMMTREAGRVSVAVRMSGSRRKRVMSLFRPMNILMTEIDIRESRDLQVIRNYTIDYAYSSIPSDVIKSSILLFVSEFVYYTVRFEPHNAPLFDFIENALIWLDNSDGRGTANFHLVFTMRMARFLGFLPDITVYNEGDFFDLRSGSFCHSCPGHEDFIEPTEAKTISTLMRVNFMTMWVLRMTREQRNRCLQLIISYYRLHVAGFHELKSPDILSDIFN
ncbi:MAG: DNA repair protein RecO [Prevotella sp.]|nr:DNA repair protein RecO [Prevotella sp.]